MITSDIKVIDYEELQQLVANIDKEELYYRICMNVKKFRLEKYREFKKNSYTNRINPYTTENLSSLLGYNHNYYKRFESENDDIKVIPLIKLVKLSVILEDSNNIGIINPFRYRGYYYDNETELYYLNNRYYNPE